jgi:hypothetical protein
MLCLLPSTTVSPFILCCVFFQLPLQYISFHPMLCLLPSTTVSPFILFCIFHPSLYLLSSFPTHLCVYLPLLRISYHAPLLSPSLHPFCIFHLCSSFLVTPAVRLCIRPSPYLFIIFCLCCTVALYLFSFIFCSSFPSPLFLLPSTYVSPSFHFSGSTFQTVSDPDLDPVSDPT